MKSFAPPVISNPQRQEDDLRLGHILGTDISDRVPPRAVILGFPSDQGVRRANGRVGASGAPDEIRKHLYRMRPDGQNPASRQLIAQVRDLGNLEISGDPDQDQSLLGVVLAPYLKEKVLPIILGGGHETAYGHFLGYVNSRQNVSILNWSCEPGVCVVDDGQGHSRSVFRQALIHSSQCCRLYTVAGLQPHGVSAMHLDFISNRSGRYYWRKAINTDSIKEIYSGDDSRLMVSFDLCAVDQSQAPGVSSPSVDGLDTQLWLRAASRAGRSGRVTSVEVVELNPLFDRDEQTARLAALTVWSFLSGMAERY